MKRFTLIKKASPVNYALESTRPPSGGRVSVAPAQYIRILPR